MSGGDHDATDPDAPAVALPQGIVKGESVPPGEHTERVRARHKEERSSLKIHDAKPPPEPSMLTSTEMAEHSRRQRRRERDRRAERRAMQLIVLMFLGLGGGAFFVANYVFEEEPPEVPPPVDPSEEVVTPPPRTGVISNKLDETPEIPAFQHLRESGLTIAAEGIPQVDALDTSGSVAALAALETCRYAYAVWEFSPNERFRFMTTCGALEGQVMFGAYKVDGAVIRMSPLVSDTDAVVSEFHVEKPSKIVSRVSRVRDGPEVLTIQQKVTAMRPGLDGEAWRSAFADRNTINLPGEKPREKAAPPSETPPPPAKKGDPLLDLLKNQ